MSKEKETVRVSKEKMKDGTEELTYRKEWKEGKMNYSMEVKKVEGGYIIRECRHGNPGEEEGGWIDETKERVSSENPFDKKKEEEKNMFDFIDKPQLM